MRQFSIAATIGLALLVSTVVAQDRRASPQARGQADRQTDTAQTVRDMHEQFETALNGGEARALAGLYSENAVLLPPAPERPEGRNAIERFWQRDLQERGLSSLTIEMGEARRIGEAIWDRGTYSISARGPEGQEVTLNGSYVVLLEQDRNNDWQITRHIWNQETAPRSE